VVLLAVEGKTNVETGMTVGLSRAMVGMWRRRYATQGMMGLYDEPRSGDPRSIEDDRIVALIRKTLQSKPKGRTHWSCRAIAGDTGIRSSFGFSSRSTPISRRDWMFIW